MKLKKKYNGTSIYRFDQMNKEHFDLLTEFVDGYLERCIGLHDMFNQLNSFINLGNNKKDNYFAPETQLMSIDSLLKLLGVKDSDHMEDFKELFYTYQGREGSPLDRALIIHQLCRDKALELRDLD